MSEYRRMNIPGGIDCPGAELVHRFFETVRSPDTLVIVNCAGRTRSIIGAQSLINAGVPNKVMALKDGTMGWLLAGYQLETGQTRHAPDPGPEARAKARPEAEDPLIVWLFIILWLAIFLWIAYSIWRSARYASPSGRRGATGPIFIPGPTWDGGGGWSNGGGGFSGGGGSFGGGGASGGW